MEGAAGEDDQAGDCPSGRGKITSDGEKATAATEWLQKFCDEPLLRRVRVCVFARAFSLRGNSQDSH